MPKEQHDWLETFTQGKQKTQPNAAEVSGSNGKQSLTFLPRSISLSLDETPNSCKEISGLYRAFPDQTSHRKLILNIRALATSQLFSNHTIGTPHSEKWSSKRGNPCKQQDVHKFHINDWLPFHIIFCLWTETSVILAISSARKPTDEAWDTTKSYFRMPK